MKPLAREVCGCARRDVPFEKLLHVYVVLLLVVVREGDVFVVVV